MYVAALSFYKILIVKEGISIAEICIYRFGILLAVETLKLACCDFLNSGSSQENQHERDSSPRYEEEGDEDPEV